MKYLKNYWKYILFCIAFMILSMTFVYTRTEWSWVFGIGSFNIFDFKESPLVNLITALLVNSIALKVMSYTVLSIAFFVIIKNIVNKKNISSFYISIFLFFLLNQFILNESYISIYGFTQNFIPAIFMLLILNYLLNDNLYRLPKVMIVILGILASSFNLAYAILILTIIIYKIILDLILKEKNQNVYLLLFGVLLVSSFMFWFNKNIFNLSVSHNIFYNVVPNILSINYIITIIILAFIFKSSIKLLFHCEDYKKANVVLSLVSIIIYAFVVLFSKNIYLNYLSLLFYIIGSFYILYNGNKSHSFKEKIKLYYFIKLAFLVIVSVLNTNVNVAFVPALMDIILILELINITFKKNFLQIPYMAISMLLIISQIVLNINTKNQIYEMNAYLKRDLSCSIDLITLPSKYKEENVSIYLPSKEEKKLFLKYLGIDDEFDYVINFTN